ncbi:MAG TPA: preprotein translocase subunit SecE [Bacillota bacterium]|nr:preprotein translocase subunit SecE [Bacillota bacterium]
MAVTRKHDDKNNKKDQGGKKENVRKKPPNPKENLTVNKPKKEPVKKALVLSKEKKDAVKKDQGRKEAAVKKEKVDRLDQLKKFWRGMINELKKVHWPNRREVAIYTSVVLVAVAAVGVMIWIFDSALSSVLNFILRR